MDKFEKTAVAVLFVGLLAWMMYSQKQAREAATQRALMATNEVVQVTDAMVSDGQASEDPALAEVPSVVIPALVPEAVHEEEKVLLDITNSQVRVTISSWGGVVDSVALMDYDTAVGTNAPLCLQMGQRGALALDGIAGLGGDSDYTLERVASAITATRKTSSGLNVSRRFELDESGYQITVTDTLVNESSLPLALTNWSVNVGYIESVKTRTSTKGYSYLGVDTLSQDGEVTIWQKPLNAQFGMKGGCSRVDMRIVPVSAEIPVTEPVQWVGLKNKFFTQILVPEEGAAGCRILGKRDLSATNSFVLGSVEASLQQVPRVLDAGGVMTASYTYYVGPKKFSELRKLGKRQDAVMFKAWPGFGWWRWACMALLGLLNVIYAILPNYGIAIILLTILVKVVFWPITHKGNLHMKKMQALQPDLAKLRAKHKDNPKKLQQAQMELYHKHGVNPLAGCLPMFVQIPIFIALFTVLRSAVELRFAGFLWVTDLSEPEGLLAGMIPFAGSLNLLPIAMTATMVIQQRLTPSAGDPQQQKIMMFMPIMMLFIFYNMASGLVLYWTVSQTLSIVQLMLQKRKEAGTPAVS